MKNRNKKWIVFMSYIDGYTCLSNKQYISKNIEETKQINSSGIQHVRLQANSIFSKGISITSAD